MHMGTGKVQKAALLFVLAMATFSCTGNEASDTWDLQGHRGARGLAPENTLPSFLAALEHGVDTIELDLVVSQDGKLVVSHEPWFNRVICDIPEGLDTNLYRLPYTDIAQIDCGSLGHPRFPNQVAQRATKPLFEEVIRRLESETSDSTRNPLWYNIETKIQPGWDGVFTPSADSFAVLLIDAITTLGIADRSIVQSFDVRTLQAVRRLAPHLQVALLVENFDGYDANVKALGFKPDIYSPSYMLVDEALRKQTALERVRLIPWTVNTLADMRRLLDLDVDGLITDYPDSAARLRTY
jgi:glycerophosphoryl diester phosphodiesterase